MTTYIVHARKWEHGWELHVDGVGVTQSHDLRGAEAMAREYIALSLDITEDEVEASVLPEVDDETDEIAAQAQKAVRTAEDAQRCAARKSREAVRRLRSAGLSGADVARYLGISPQRVSQLAKRGPAESP